MEFVTVKEASERLKTSEQMVRRYIREKRIKAVKHGRKYIIDTEYLEKLIKKGF